MIAEPSRALSSAIEPFAGQVYFAPECHRGYAALGFGPSPATSGGVEIPDIPAYFCSRGSALGQAPGAVIAATFAVFNPAVVVPAVEYGWTLTDAPSIRAARTEGSVGQLSRVLGAAPEGVQRAVQLLSRAVDGLSVAGKPLFAGLVADGLVGEPLADAWLLADQLREFRGDAHVNAWDAAGFDAVEIGLITELYLGFPPRTYIRTRAWSDEQLTAGEARLAERGLARDGTITDAGRAAREAIETATDAACAPIVARLGEDLEELTALVGGWSAQLLAAGAFPKG
ncbi:SCO6745 family protein [Mycolicibacter minnesotensis]